MQISVIHKKQISLNRQNGTKVNLKNDRKITYRENVK